MERKNIFALTLIVAILFATLVTVSQITFVTAQDLGEDGNYKIPGGLELEKVILLINGWLATFLFVLAFVAYKRDGRTRLLFVSLAFLLFAIKSFLVSSELFFPEIEWFDPLATILEFGVILSFFFGVLKK